MSCNRFLSLTGLFLLTPTLVMGAEQGLQDLLDTLRDNGTITEKQYDRILRSSAPDDGGDQVKVTTKGGLEVSSYDGRFSFTLGGRLMVDAAFYNEDLNTLGDGTELRRARIEAAGSLYGNWEYELGVDFGGGAAEVKDAYLSYAMDSSKKIKMGNFKEPFSLEELTSSKYSTFMERGLANEFAPGRSMGLAVQGWGDMWTYALGIFGDGYDDDPDNEGDEGWGATGRLTMAPWHDERKVLHFGAALSHREPGDTKEIDFAARPESHVTDIKHVNTGTITDVDSLCKLGGEAAFVTGPVSLQGEYMHVRVIRQNSQPDVDFDGWYVYGSWFITGESRQYKSKNGVFGRQIPWARYGAFEVSARYSVLDLNDGPVTGGKEKNVTLGVNWYANPQVKVMANYIWVNNDANADDDGAAVGNDDPRLVQFRLQVDF